MDTYFIRHTRDLDIDAATRDMLWNSRKIAIHFPNNKHEKLEDEDNSSLNPDDYPKTDQRAIRAMKALSQTGGYVCAQYYQHTEHLLGYVRPNSKIQLIRGAWGSENGLDGREAILKCLPLEKIKVASPSDIAIILVGRPQQGTISRWPRAGDLIERIVDGRRMEPSLDTLSPQQQEIMCSEFLRSNSTKAFGLPKLAHLLLPVGRTMKDVDICGITETGKILFAQVTRATLEQSVEKLEALRKYGDSGKNKLIFFCDRTEPKEALGVLIVPLQYVYEQFTTMATGRSWLDHSIPKLRD